MNQTNDADSNFNSNSTLVFKVTPGFGCLSHTKLEDMETDLLVLTVMQGAQLSARLDSLDRSLKGRISQSFRRHHFNGHLGQHLVIDLQRAKTPQTHILIVGLGEYEAFDRNTACALFGLILSECARLQATKVIIPIAPRRLTEDELSLRTTAAILRCRVHQFMSASPDIFLKEIEIVCSPQAKRHLEAGLNIERTLCSPCSKPEIDTEENK